MKFRKSCVKRQHSIIGDLGKLLASLGDWPEVDGIIPGRIKQARHRGQLEISVSYETSSGLKAIARTSGVVQEVFFITKCPQQLWERLKKEKVVET